MECSRSRVLHTPLGIVELITWSHCGGDGGGSGGGCRSGGCDGRDGGGRGGGHGGGCGCRDGFYKANMVTHSVIP